MVVVLLLSVGISGTSSFVMKSSLVVGGEVNRDPVVDGPVNDKYAQREIFEFCEDRTATGN